VLGDATPPAAKWDVVEVRKLKFTTWLGKGRVCEGRDLLVLKLKFWGRGRVKNRGRWYCKPRVR